MSKKEKILPEKEQKFIVRKFLELWFSFNLIVFFVEAIVVVVIFSLLFPESVYFLVIEGMMYIFIVEGILLLIFGFGTNVKNPYDTMKYAFKPKPGLSRRDEEREAEEFTESVKVGKSMFLKLGAFCLILSAVYFLLLRNFIYALLVP